MYSVEKLRAQFPILAQKINGKPLAYLDSAASAQVPTFVLDAHIAYYTHDHANVHRGAHTLAERATQKYEEARETVAAFIGATAEEIIFTKGTTESDNLVAYSLLFTFPKGSEVVITEMDHHSNFVVWQQLCKKYNLTLKVIPVTPDFRLDMDAAHKIISQQTRLVALPHVSNVLGTMNPIQEIAKIAHNIGALVLVDGAQAVAHTVVNVQELDVDFYSFSGHKLYAGTGIGVLYAKKSVQKNMQPFLFGGGMIENVTTEDTTFTHGPARFEAGTPNMAGAICLATAIQFLQDIGIKNIAEHEHTLTKYALEQLLALKNAAVIGPHSTTERGGVLSFVVNGIHANDVAAVLDKEGIAVRAGHHCAQPLALRMHIPSTVRASIALYTTKEEIDRLIAGIKKAQEIFA